MAEEIPIVISQPEVVSPTEVYSQPPGAGFPVKAILIALGVVAVLLAGVLIFKLFLGPKLGSVTLTYWGLWETEKTLEPIIADFNKKNSRIKINYVKQSPKQYRERLASSLARGEGPDIFRFHNTWLPMFSKELAAVPAKTVNEINYSQNFYPVIKEDLRKGVSYYGVPLEIDGLGLYVNEEIFKQAGVGYPVTWEELRSTALKLTVKDEAGKIRVSGAALGLTGNVEHWSDILGLMMLQNGVDLTNPVGNLAEDALIYFTLFSRFPDNTWDATLDNSIYAFSQGKVAMILAPSWQAFEIKNLNPALNFKILPAPQLPGGNITWASYWAEGVWSKSKYQTEAFEFLQYLASKEAMTKLYSEEAKTRLFGEPYSRIDLAPTLANDPYAGAFVSQAPNAKSFYLASRTFDNGLNDKIIKYFEDAVNSLDKGVSAAAALETAAKGVSQILSTYGLAAPLTSAPAQ